MNQEKVTRRGMSSASIIGVVFLILKLTHTIDWPWVWVLSPFWIPIAVFLLMLTVGGLMIGLAYVLKRK